VINSRTESSPITNPHGSSSRGMTTSILKIVYFLVDYWLGFLLEVSLLKRRSSLVVFDRYFNDIWVDPKRYRMSIPSGIIRFAFKLFPQPDLWVVLHADPLKIIERKPEVSLEECQRQVAKYRRLAKQLPNCLLVDTSAEPDISANEIYLFIAERFAARQESP